MAFCTWLLFVFCVTGSGFATLTNLEDCDVIDLSWSFGKDTIYWPGALQFNKTDPNDKHRVDTPGTWYRGYNYKAAEHGGTHLDAPHHMAIQGITTDELPVKQFIGEACVIDVTDKVAADRDYLLSISDIQDWEKDEGSIDDCVLIMRTGNEKNYPNKLKYLGADDGTDDDLHFPGLDPNTAQWIVDNRNIKAFGLDTASIDHGPSKDFRAHRILFGKQIPGMENLMNLAKLPARGANIIGLPMKIKGGSGGPLRVFALGVNDKDCSREKLQIEKCDVLDMSYSFDDLTIYWPGALTFKLTDPNKDGRVDKSDAFYRGYNYEAAEHGGTHIDAPHHFAIEGTTSDKLPATQFLGELCVVDVRKKCEKDADYLLSVNDITDWEAVNGLVNDCILVMQTGFEKYYPNKAQYLGQDDGTATDLHFPGMDPKLAQWLIDNRKIKAFGLDTPSIDFGQSKDFQSHRILYGKQIPGLENMMNLDKLPTRGATLVGGQMKIEGGSGGPIRLIAVGYNGATDPCVREGGLKIKAANLAARPAVLFIICSVLFARFIW